MSLKVRPTDNRVLVRLDEPKEPSESLWVPEEWVGYSDTGTVAARGPKVRWLHRGDRVRWNVHARGQARLKGDAAEYVLIREAPEEGTTIMATIEEGTMSETLKPLGKRVLVERDEAEEKTSGGIFIPPSVREKERPVRGTVRAIGDEVEGVAVGDRVLFSQWVGSDTAQNGEALTIMLLDDIQAVIEEC